MEELNDLHLFAQVVEAGGFSAAERSTAIPSCAVASACSSNMALGGKRLDAQHFVPRAVTSCGQLGVRQGYEIV